MRWCRVFAFKVCLLKRPSRPDLRRRRGYVSLLAMAFTVGLAILGGALTTGLLAYLNAASAEHRRTLDRISLESAATAVLGRIAAGEDVSLTPTSLPPEQINGRMISVEVSSPMGKYDPRGDPESLVADALKARGFDRPVKEIVDAGGLGNASNIWKLSSSEEDCLRRFLTYGRAPAELSPDLAQKEPEGPAVIAAGDQLDLRLELQTASDFQILWVRARFTGQGGGWKLHDYRALQLPKQNLCR